MLSCRMCGWFGSNTGPLAYCPECGSQYLRSSHSEPAPLHTDDDAHDHGSAVEALLIVLAVVILTTFAVLGKAHQ